MTSSNDSGRAGLPQHEPWQAETGTDRPNGVNPVYTAEAARRLDYLRTRLVHSSGLDSIPPPVPLIDGLLFLATLAWQTGAPDNGKSLSALDMAGCISTGLPWHGHEVQQGHVLYVAAEGASGQRQRVAAWEQEHGRAMDVTFLTEAVRLPADGPLLATIAADLHAVLVVIDTQHRCSAGLDENSSKDMGLLIGALDEIRRISGACVLTLHHTPRNADNPRGSTSLEGAADSLLRVVKTGQQVMVANTRQKDAPLARPVYLQLESCRGSVVLRAADNSGDNSNGLAKASPRANLLEVFDSEFGVNGEPCSGDFQKASGLPPSTFHDKAEALVKRGALHKRKDGRRILYSRFPPAGQLPITPTTPG